MLNKLINLAQNAGQLVLSVYNQPTFEVMKKTDNSALTEADIASHTLICDTLHTLYPNIPVISEESSEQYDFDTRKEWDYFFLVDPLDGTKEFIHRNGEFTINIALIKKNKPVLGIVHAPAIDVTYYAEEHKGAYKIKNHEIIKLLPISTANNVIRVAVSRSHGCAKTDAFLKTLEAQGKEIKIIPMGSALKFGLVAEGTADIYPRLAPTMEWDTAAGQIVVNEVGKKVLLVDSHEQLQYNKEVLINPSFIVQ